MKLPASNQCLLPPEIRGQAIVAFNIGADGSACFVIAEEPLDYRSGSPQQASFPKTMPDRPQRYRVVVLRGGEVELDVPITDEPFNIHEVQPLGDDLLLACCRSYRRSKDDVDLNGRIYDRLGRFQSAICLGDGIETIQASSSGDIWTSYFDEGVFGNFGWSEPLGASGLVAWRRDGTPAYRFEPTGEATEVADCYALNVVSDDEVWLYYYTDFQLVQLRHRAIEAVHVPNVQGSSAFAVSRNRSHALFVGGYSDHQSFELVALAGGKRAPKRMTPLDLEGRPVEHLRAVGRGPSLYLLTADHLFRYDVGDAVKWSIG